MNPFLRFRSELSRLILASHPVRDAELCISVKSRTLNMEDVGKFSGHVNETGFGFADPETVKFLGVSAALARPWWKFWEKTPRTYRTTYYFAYRPKGWNTQLDSNGRIRGRREVYPTADAS